MGTIDDWARDRIVEASPEGAAVTGAVQQLIETVLFFQGRRSTLFGMTSTPDAFADGAQLDALARDGVRAWFELLQAESNEAACEGIVDADKRFQLELGLPRAAPKKDALRPASRAEGLATVPSPLAALAEADGPLAEHVRGFVDGTDAGAIAAHLELLLPEAMRGSLSDFAWAGDDWSCLPNGLRDPCFLPLGGADGDLVGLYLHRATGNAFRAPVVYYFHEEDPPFTWMAESLAHLDAMVRVATGRARKDDVVAARGELHREDEGALRVTYFEDRTAPEERRLVHALAWAADEGERLRAAHALETIYSAPATWNPYALASLRMQALRRDR